MRRLGIVLAIVFAVLPPFVSAQTVTPKGSTVTVPVGSTNTQTFHVSNFAGDTHFMELSVSCDFASCSIPTASMYVDPGTTNVTVTYSSVTGPGTIYLTVADDDQGTSDQGTLNVSIASSTPNVTYSEDTWYTSENANTNYPHFHVTNSGNTASAYTLVPSCTGNVAPDCTATSSGTINPGASADVVVYYHTGGFASGNVSVTLTATSQYSESASKTITVVPLSENVTVGANGSGAPEPGASSNASFTVTDVGNSSPVTYATSFSCSGIVTSCPSGSSVTVSVGSPQTVTPSYSVSSSLAGGTGAITMTASISDGFNTYSSSSTYNVAVTDHRTYTAAVTPGAAEYSAEQQTATSYAFTVSNAGNTSATYSLSASTCSGGETSCAPRVSSVTLGGGASTTVYVDFNVSAAGSTGYVALTASGPSNSSTGQIHVTPTTSAVSLSPSSTSASVWTSGTGSLTYTATNNGNVGTVTYNVAVTCSGSVASCTLPGGSAVSIGQGSTASITVNYTASGSTGSGGISLHVYKTVTNTYEAYASATITVSTAPTYGVTVTPDGQAVSYGQSTSHSSSFTLTNTGNVSNTFTVTTSCSGTVSGCSVTSTNPVTVAGGSNTTVTMSYNVGSPGTGTAGINVTGTSASDGGSYSVTALPPAPAVSLDSANSGEVVARDQCVTLSLGAGAASECGDLRLAHALPSVRTLDKERAPTMVYNSAHASPTPIVTADVTIASGTSPDSIRATITINSTQYATRTWSLAAWGATGVARRIGLSFDGSSLSTGSYGYTLTVTSYAGGVAGTSNATGTLIVVNRSASAYGAGWWIAGWEHIYTLADTTARLWVGGDGSARVYHKSHDSVYVAASLDRPDSLTWNAGISRYVRWDDHRLQVRFDVSGTHVETVNRLGHTTVFASSSGTAIDSIGVPTATSARQWYHFNYTSGKLSSVTAPGSSGSRTVTFAETSSRVTSIAGPDTTSVGFAYVSGTNKVSSRTNRLGNVVYYAYDAASKVDTLRMDMAGDVPQIVTRLRPAESQAVVSSAPLAIDSVYTLINGPRIDTTVTRIWINRWGAPKKIKDAAGHVTSLVRGNSTFPALVTADTAPNGFVTQATYDSHGNISTSTSVGGAAHPTMTAMQTVTMPGRQRRCGLARSRTPKVVLTCGP